MRVTTFGSYDMRRASSVSHLPAMRPCAVIGRLDPRRQLPGTEPWFGNTAM